MAADTTEFLLGKISGQLDGFEQRLDELREATQGVGARQTTAEDRIGKLERSDARRSGALGAIAALAGVLGGGFVTFIAKKLG